MLLSKSDGYLRLIAATPEQLLKGFASFGASVAVNIALVLGALLNAATPRYLPGLAQFKGNGFVAVTLLDAAMVQAPQASKISKSDQALDVPKVPSNLLDAAQAPSAANPFNSASVLAPSQTAPVTAAVDEFATPSLYLMRQLRLIAGEQLVELKVSVLLGTDGTVESLEILSSKGDLKVIAGWISLLRGARFMPASRQSQSVASKQVFEFSTY